DSAADADQLSGPYGRARSLADARRHGDRAAAQDAGHSRLAPLQPAGRAAPHQGCADAGARLALAGRGAVDPRADVGGIAMLRVDALQAIYPELKEQIVVTIMGAVAAELYTIGHRPNFFYLEHAMGLASSMGLGIALSKPRHKVVVIDGDGSLLMNLGT